MLQQMDVDNLMNQLRVELLGSSDILLQSMMYQVMTEFFNDSSFWTEGIQINAQPQVHAYQITPTEGQIIRLASVVHLGFDNLGHVNGHYFVPALMPEIGVVHAEHAPANAETWMAHVVKNVSLPTLKGGVPIAPEFTLKQWFLAIKEGILGNMMNQADKSWSSPKQALYHLSKFRRYINEARSIKLRANTVGASAWRFPQGYRVNSQQGGVPSFGGTERSFG